MKIRRIEFANVGPFVGDHVIDFSQLASPLFLIDGPTGVGKSTIIDAIVYALYDRVAAENSDPHRLRSMHANPADETFVELEFEVQDRRYRVRRSPAYLRKARRGDGLTRNQPQVALYEFVQGEWQFREDKAQPVGAEIKRIIGLDREQFVQTVVLPQGEFAKFLHATSAERKPILQRIFHTSGFQALEGEFARRAEEARLRRADVMGEAERITSLLDAERDGEEDVDPLDLLELRSAERARIQHDVRGAEERAAMMNLALDGAKRKNAATQSLAEARERLDRAESDVQACPTPIDSRGVAELNAALAKLEHVIQLQRQLREGEALAEQRSQQIAELERDLLALHGEKSQLVADVLAAIEEAETAVRAAAAAEVVERAAVLAEELVDDEPCPVCGSREHPNPATARVVSSDLGHALDIAARVNALHASLDEIDDLPSPMEGVCDVRSLERRRTELDAQWAENERTLTSLRAAQLAWDERRGDIERVAIDEVALETELAEVANAIAVATAFERAQAALTQAKVACERAQSHPDLQLDAPELDEAIADATSAAAEVATLTAEFAHAERSVEKLERLIAQLCEIEARVAEVEAATAPVIRLANVIAGKDDNLLQQPLSVYVLQTMFDDVIDAANARLAGMLNGRYELLATEESSDRRRSTAGLDLTVLDHDVDDDRTSKTLSGGETFCVSLALALGLADTVHAYSGGVSIDTLFIDEGFGSLDAETLEDVMTELERLAADGRTVGVISHVEAMKAIPERIEVHPTKDRRSQITVSWE